MSGSVRSGAEAPKVRRNWLTAAVLAAAICVPLTALSPAAHAATKAKKQRTFDQKAAALAKRLVGDPYVYGGTSPAGFDCSGLAQYVYRHAGRGRSIQRTAEDQFLEFRRISHRSARPGDLVFFHAGSDPDSYVYHVGVYEGGDMMVAATTWGEGVQLQNFSWAGDTVTFGTITH